MPSLGGGINVICYRTVLRLANRSKRGMALDLKSPGGAKVLRRLVEWADVVITNFPHGTREKLHLGYDQVAQWNPRVIYADVTGFGDAGPDALRRSALCSAPTTSEATPRLRPGNGSGARYCPRGT